MIIALETTDEAPVRTYIAGMPGMSEQLWGYAQVQQLVHDRLMSEFTGAGWTQKGRALRGNKAFELTFATKRYFSTWEAQATHLLNLDATTPWEGTLVILVPLDGSTTEYLKWTGANATLKHEGSTPFGVNVEHVFHVASEALVAQSNEIFVFRTLPDGTIRTTPDGIPRLVTP